jgi:hypothetical protein
MAPEFLVTEIFFCVYLRKSASQLIYFSRMEKFEDRLGIFLG